MRRPSPCISWYWQPFFGSASATNTAAPAPSPKMIETERSPQSTRRVSTSTPMTAIFSARPQRIMVSAMFMPYRKPLHAAARSKTAASPAPTASLMRAAVDGQIISPLTLATMIMSSSSAFTPERSSAFSRASRPSEKTVSESLALWRARMPVRCAIHSSLVSTIFSSSLLVSTHAGTARPVPAIRTPRPKGALMPRPAPRA